MTHEEMAAELTKAKWRVSPPITQDTCSHPNLQGMGSMGCDGSSTMESHCPVCGYKSKHVTPPRMASFAGF